MANEAVCIETPTRFRRYTVAAGGFSYGQIVQLSGDYTVTASSADGEICAGIVWEELSTTDFSNGKTEVTVALDGVWDLKDAGAGITLGYPVTIGGANLIKAAAAGEAETGDIMGKAEETAAASEVIRVAVWIP